MCLRRITKHKKAKEPIPCYKIMLLIIDSGLMKVNSVAYPDSKGYIVGDTITSRFNLSRYNLIDNWRIDRLKNLNGEVVHSYHYYDVNMPTHRRYARIDARKLVFVECEIPKGVSYWVGADGEYGSKSLVIKNIYHDMWLIDVNYRWGLTNKGALAIPKDFVSLDGLKADLETPEYCIENYTIFSYNVITGESHLVHNSALK